MRKFMISAAILVALVACSKKEEKTTTITSSDGKTVNITSTGNDGENGTITFQGEDGTGKISFGADAAKEGLPMGLPIYPGGEVKGSFMGSGGEGGSGGMVTILTSDAAAKITEFYKAEAVKRGLEIKTTATGSDNMSSFTAKGDKGSLIVTASPESSSGKTAAVLIVGTK